MLKVKTNIPEGIGLMTTPTLGSPKNKRNNCTSRGVPRITQTYNSQILFKAGTLDMWIMATKTANVVPRANEINVRGIVKEIPAFKIGQNDEVNISIERASISFTLLICYCWISSKVSSLEKSLPKYLLESSVSVPPKNMVYFVYTTLQLL